MIIGVPKEIKNNENRVALTPSGVDALVKSGHEVLIETNAGTGSSFTNEDYEKAGAKIVSLAKEAWAAEMVMKVKEPLPEEYAYFREGLILFTYLHLAAEPDLAAALTKNNVVAIAYETIEVSSLPWTLSFTADPGTPAAGFGASAVVQKPGVKGQTATGKIYINGSVVKTSNSTANDDGHIMPLNPGTHTF